MNPLALVQRGPIIYLLCTRPDRTEDDIRMFALHRFSRAEVAEQRAVRPEKFDLDQYLASGALGFKTASLAANDTEHAENTPVVLRFSATAGQGLLECRLSADQHSVIEEDGKITINASVPLTAQLIWWLRGFGGDVEVLAPDHLMTALTADAAF